MIYINPTNKTIYFDKHTMSAEALDILMEFENYTIVYDKIGLKAKPSEAIIQESNIENILSTFRCKQDIIRIVHELRNLKVPIKKIAKLLSISERTIFRLLNKEI